MIANYKRYIIITKRYLLQILQIFNSDTGWCCIKTADSTLCCFATFSLNLSIFIYIFLKLPFAFEKKKIIPIVCVLTVWLMWEAAEETVAGLVAMVTWLLPPF